MKKSNEYPRPSVSKESLMKSLHTILTPEVQARLSRALAGMLYAGLPDPAREKLEKEQGEPEGAVKFLQKLLDTPYGEWEKIGAGWLKEYFVEDEE